MPGALSEQGRESKDEVEGWDVGEGGDECDGSDWEVRGEVLVEV